VNTLALSAKDLHIIKDVLRKYPYKFYAFGSRVSGKHKKFSDLDLFYKEPIPLAIIADLEHNFAESDLPFKVDIVDWHNCSNEFQQLIAKNCIEITIENAPRF
jgi:predicted nucleotidyltransferase